MNKIYIITLIITLSVISFMLYNKFAFLNIVVKFDNLEPIEKQMNVYYKGFKIGKTVKIYPDKDYKNTYLKLKLKPHDVNLPANITAKIKKNALSGYVDIEYPDSPSLTRIKNYDEIKGRSAKDLNSALSDKLGDDGIDKIVDDAADLVSSANVTVHNLGEVFSQVNDILKDMKKDIRTASSNLAKTTENLENISANLNKALDEEVIKNSVNNIDETTENIKQITRDLSDITTQIDRTTVPIVNSVLCETNSTVKNVKEITGGIKNTLKKHMGLGRLLFGKPVSENNGCQN